MNGLKGPQAGERRRGDCQLPSLGLRVQLDPASSRTSPYPAPESSNFSVSQGSDSGAPTLRRRHPRRNYLDKTDATKEPKNRQNGRLLLFDPKENVMLEPKEAMSEKKVSSKKIENKVSLKNTEKRVSSKNIKNKDFLTNLQSDQWPSSFLKESTGEGGKDTIIAKQEKTNEHCVQSIDKLSESTDADGEDDTSDEDDEDSNPKKDTRAPLELMAEFLRAEMGRDYHLAKKLCQMIIIYEPENPEAKEFLSLIEEMLLMEKAQNLKEDEEDSEEDSSGESEGEGSEDLSDESSDECEDGS
ncbi:glutamate-rich protein 2 [Marmota monax]|uniref:glutamate-rich protein 2 n=1 Tax=Marmota monax TaxID=9995 RepID=UPI001EB013CF|nr:glutamate-rich protein 2 [Marmota monax]